MEITPCGYIDVSATMHTPSVALHGMQVTFVGLSLASSDPLSDFQSDESPTKEDACLAKLRTVPMHLLTP